MTDVARFIDSPSAWYSRGYLPHCDERARTQMITFRLDDSLSQESLSELEVELEDMPQEEHTLHRRQQIEKWLDQGIGCCALGHAQAAELMQEVLLFGHQIRYRLHAWVIMPNHVHVLITPRVDIATIIQSWKSYSSRRLWSMNESHQLGLPESRRVWRREYWDRFIRDRTHYAAAIDYIHTNPVKARLCKDARDWPWSSARRPMPSWDEL